MSESKKMVDQTDEPPPVGGTSAGHDVPQNDSKVDGQGLKTSVDSAVDLNVIVQPPDSDCSSSASVPRDLAPRPRAD